VNRLRILVSAHACEPGKGSESGIGWNAVRSLAQYHDLWVLTRTTHRKAILAACGASPPDGLHFEYFDLPAWLRWWKHGQWGVQLYYYIWQAAIIPKIRRLHRTVHFDCAHHLTFGRYWSPTPLAVLEIPFIWGPCGGAESAPAEFCRHAGFAGFIFEYLRNLARTIGEHDPFVRMAARKSALAIAATGETKSALSRIGAKKIALLSNVALNAGDIAELGTLPQPPNKPFCFISSGRLLAWKGFDMTIAAFAQAHIRDAQYWILGDGPDRKRLAAIARRMNVSSSIIFCGHVPRNEAFRKLAACHTLLHPSVHDSGGWVCAEAMAAGRPVVCLAIGGPAHIVAADTGFCIRWQGYYSTIAQLKDSMITLALNEELRMRMARAARRRIEKLFTWKYCASRIGDYYYAAAGHTGAPASAIT
jgi:glycosyltransferase involved in cell wall biosynthesis